jgi:hypothetical protein
VAHRRTPPRCVCGVTYAEFRTGLTFADVRRMMWCASDDPKMWRSKRRRSVLGFFRELKLNMFDAHHGYCD